MITVAILLPTKNRAAQMKRNVTNLLMEFPPRGVQMTLVLAIVRGDEATAKAAGELVSEWAETDAHVQIVWRDADTTSVQGWNMAHQAARDADWFFLGADDQIFRPGWLTEALRVANVTGAQVIGPNDNHTPLDEYAPHYLVHRDFIEAHLDGHFVPPAYKSWWFDREVCERAKAVGLYAPAWYSIVEHRHPDWGTAPMDATYQDAWARHDDDRILYEQRRANGYA